MAQASTRPQASAIPTAVRVTSYDRAASWLVALLVLSGTSFAFLLGAWLAGKPPMRPKPRPVEIPDVGGGSPTGIPGESMQIDSPNKDEIAAETDLQQNELQDTLAMVVDAVATNQAAITDPSLSSDVEVGGPSGPSKGDGRAVGLGYGNGEPGIPRAQRWEMRFAEGATLQDYARQLDYFKIELGAVGVNSEVQYAFNLSASRPELRVGPAKDEQRLYMSWQQGSLKEADRALLARAGAALPGRQIVQFYPQDLENELAGLELAYRGREQGQIRKTIFGVRAAGDGYEFYVIEQIPM
ncbi:MAG: hypothetical protein K1X74_09015 [Pirellulales bacterium]|nr:hypothetical protein [Pirellulales bacterium]